MFALYADSQGNIYDAVGMRPVGMSGYGSYKLLAKEDFIALPEGASVVYLPERWAYVADKKGKIEKIASGICAVAALLPPGYTRLYLPAYSQEDNVDLLPLQGYAAVAVINNKMHVAAMKTDNNRHWRALHYNTPNLSQLVYKTQKMLPDNKIVQQLAKCALTWSCQSAQNFFYHRWEAGLPSSNTCNANCLGCISLQPAECCPSPQQRLAFTPSVTEVAQVLLRHLSSDQEPIISFGQGCEGEPALMSSTLAAAMREVRAQTANGMININTNAGYTKGIKELVDAGLDSMRVSIISAREAVYNSYYRQTGYTLADVKDSIAYAKEHGVYVSLNMLTCPGLNDRSEEVGAWIEFLLETKVDLLQIRNLTIDPKWLFDVIPPGAEYIGIKEFLIRVKQAVPELEIGNFSHYVKEQE